MATKPSTKPARKKPKHGDAPPFNNGAGRWTKKVNGRLIYFGTIADDPVGDNARRVWREQKDAIKAGRKPVLGDNEPQTGVNVKELCDEFLSAKEE